MTSVTAYTNARILDPATGTDTMGGLIVEDGVITEVGANVTAVSGGGAGAVVWGCGSL